jgi:carbamoyltransferase
MIILGINPGSHDSAACLVQDGVLIAAVEEERFTRRKYALGEMPWNASLYCLSTVGITLEDVDSIAICWAGPDQPENSVRFYDEVFVNQHNGYYKNKLFPESYFGNVQLPPIAHVSHHLAHAACAYRCSSFDDAAVLVVDGQGENVSTSIAHGHNGQLEFLTQFGIKDSLGYFYQAISEYLGFGWLGGEGKTMGLAAYGEACFDFPEFSLLNDGYSVAIPKPGMENPTKDMLRFWRSYLEDRFGQSQSPARRYDPIYGRCQKTKEFSGVEKNIAASAQIELEQVYLHLISLALRYTTSKNIALSGGVTLNCSANGKIFQALQSEPFIFPAAGDAGASVGAALEVSAMMGSQASKPFKSPYLGPDFSSEAIEKTLKNFEMAYSFCPNPSAKAAELIAEGNSVGWFQGRTEIGPRALGHRSILADPSSQVIRDRVNASVKHREMWRPFAPSLLKEASCELFGRDVDSPYMLLAVPVPTNQQYSIKGTVHVDGTTRPQTVNKDDDPLFFDLIQNHFNLTNIPAVLNTSFNDETEPIVCTPRDALRTFWTTGLDYLILGSFMVGPKNL